MLEQKNYNLPEADGNPENKIAQEVKNSKIEKAEDTNKKVLDEIENSKAEESEDETLTERHDIPMLDYESMSMEALAEELEKLLATGKVASIKEHVEEIRKEFYNKYHSFIDDKREEFATENNGDTTEIGRASCRERV